jgi:hypothetical protein
MDTSQRRISLPLHMGGAYTGAARSGHPGHARPDVAALSDSMTAPGQNRPVASHDDASNREPLLTEPEAARVIRVSARTLRRWRAEGSGPHVAGYAGRRALYRRSDLLAWLRRKERAP